MRFMQLLSKLPALSVAVVVVLLAGCGEDKESAQFNLPDVVDFNFHVKPILSDSCFLCHGPDLSNAKAGLSLNTFALATETLLDSGAHPIVPGKPEKSEIYARMMSDDESFMMPPPESNLTLSARDKAMIKKWIKQGAEYKKHWAFITPTKAELPEVNQANWVANPIDHFVLKQMEQNSVAPAKQADKETLIRRVTFDLTGLPPTLEEVDAFLADTSSDAYEKVVKRLVNSVAYGERMAVEWLDVARYADTFGYSVDRYRNMSPYRDWVIDAFTNNMPFDKFVTWQLAGDLLPNASQEQRLATAFNRVHAQNGEGGIVNEEFRVEYVKDRVQTVGTGLLGLTMHCAQCHDHKYDEISAKDYYETFAMFNSIDESGQISWDANDIPVPTMLMPSDEESQKIASLESKMHDLSTELNLSRRSALKSMQEWRKDVSIKRLDFSGGDALLAHYPLAPTDTNAGIASASNKKMKGVVHYGADAKKKVGPAMVHVNDEGRDAIKLNGDDLLFFGEQNHFDRANPFTVSIDAKFPETFKEGVLLHYNKAAILYNFKGFEIAVEDNYWIVRLAHTYPYNAIALRSKAPIVKKAWQTISLAYDGSSSAAGVQFYVNGVAVDMHVERDNLYKDFRHTDEGVVKGMGLKVGARWRGRGTPDTLVDNIKVWSRALTSLELQAIAGKTPSLDNDDEALAYYNARENKPAAKLAKELTQLRIEHNTLAESVFEMMVMQELPEKRQAYILERGSYASHGEPVEPGVPDAVLPFDDSLPRNRLGFAQWLTDKQHPLMPRVVVNRYWMMLMGTGIVRTPEDFGNQGELPTHPALLDWLSREFVDSGWDVKHVMSLIATSASYKQSSVAAPEVVNADPENRLYSRGPSARLTAEMLRDNVLAASGLLVNKIGGESVYPYQPEGLWRMNQAKYEQGSGDDLYRRSMYTIWKRSVPPPSMHNFDTPTRSYSVGTRQATNTPLQALTLMNDPQYVEAGRALAERVMLMSDDNEMRIKTMFRLLTSKQPDAEEMQVMTDMYQASLKNYSAEPEKATELLSVGESAFSQTLDKSVLASFSTLANLIMNHDATVIKR